MLLLPWFFVVCVCLLIHFLIHDTTACAIPPGPPTVPIRQESLHGVPVVNYPERLKWLNQRPQGRLFTSKLSCVEDRGFLISTIAPIPAVSVEESKVPDRTLMDAADKNNNGDYIHENNILLE